MMSVNPLNNQKILILYLAEEQTKGRGRMGKEWSSPVGNIYMSIAFLSQNLMSL